jgi:hypothetical protein
MMTFDLAQLLFALFLTISCAGQSYPQTIPKRSPEQIKASIEAHEKEFDYLLGDWEGNATNKEYGAFRVLWSAVRLADGAQILDEYRVVSEKGETWYVSITLRSYNAVLDQWELLTTEVGRGLHDIGTAHKVGSEIHIEQTFGVMSQQPSIWRIRYYNIAPNSFSWTADRSVDGGKTWEKDYMKIETRRIGPARTLPPLAPARPANDKKQSRTGVQTNAES